MIQRRSQSVGAARYGTPAFVGVSFCLELASLSDQQVSEADTASAAKSRYETTTAALGLAGLGGSGHCLDGDWYDKEEKSELSTDQSETLAKFSESHQPCMDIQMTMWGQDRKRAGLSHGLKMVGRW